MESERPASISETTPPPGQGVSPGTASSRRNRADLAISIAAALIWVILAVYSGMRFSRSRDLLDVGLLLFNSLVAWSFLRRRPALRKGQCWESVLAWTGTFAPWVVFHPADRGLHGLGIAVQGVGWIGMMAALWSLRRSLDIPPADRGLVTQGPYRFVRHPLYASELLFYVGYSIANLSLANFAGLALQATIQVARLLREERIISGYEDYARQVRWRLIPWIY